MRMTTQQTDRAAGVLLGQACGDALGVPYEFSNPPRDEPQMIGGGLGPYAPGEWSDDTQMAVCIARVAATGADLTSSPALDQVADAFEQWARQGASDIGNQTRSVLSAARRGVGTPGERLTRAGEAFAVAHPRSAGNGALMRTGIVGLTRPDSRERTAASARAVAALTHADPLAADSCVLWSEAVRLAVSEGRLDLLKGLDLLPAERRAQWCDWITEATEAMPQHLSPNGFTVTALQAAWAAITSTDHHDGSPLHLQRALTAAVQAGDDTDTVAAIAGALLGARYGASAVPFRWRRRVHGWPGLRGRDLVGLAIATARRGNVFGRGWPEVDTMRAGYEQECAIPHPHDPEVLLGTFADLHDAPRLGVDAVVSLCRVGRADLEAAGVSPEDHVEMWLVDSELADDNTHLAFVLDEAAAAVQAFRSEGKRVLLHCVAAQQRTPSAAVRYAVRLGIDANVAAEAIVSALPSTRGRGLLWQTALGADLPTSAKGA
ncbi:ADP-ribosylglycohydrolase family protein [Knoellia sp. 3-2P3]|uniref:ADP-ribosylglycohydrolase family protein n=1 Tax=unclassified Knoellia TaxID=2618719 RepID=UPI0023DC4AF7|nr:ADP-ribosylglycohydrolase family protein [Knoellia sp. 3-2P3]MDF2092575.1 ADP-ribosylglycohydrolase family protein [Knoellia sp. 3-2P3]